MAVGSGVSVSAIVTVAGGVGDIWAADSWLAVAVGGTSVGGAIAVSVMSGCVDVAVGVALGVGVWAAVGRALWVCSAATAGALVGLAVGVIVGTAVFVDVGLSVLVGDGLTGSGVLVDSGVAVAVFVMVATVVDVNVGVSVGVSVRVAESAMVGVVVSVGGSEAVGVSVAVGCKVAAGVGWEQVVTTLALLRGDGVALIKSSALTSVSIQPSSKRRSAVVLESPAPAIPPSALLALP